MTLKELGATLLGAISPQIPLMAEAQRLIHAYEKEVGTKTWDIKPSEYTTGKVILEAEPGLQVAVVQSGFSMPRTWGLDALLSQMLRRNLPYTPDAFQQIFAGAIEKGEYYGHWSMLLKVVQRYVKETGLTPLLREGLQKMHDGCHGHGADSRKLKSQLAEALGDKFAGLPDAGIDWADAVHAQLSQMEPTFREAWSAFFAHVATADGSKPSAKWLATGETHRAVIGTNNFTQRVTEWMNKVAPPPPLEAIAPKYPTPEQQQEEPNARAIYQAASTEYYAQVAEYQSRISDKNITMLKGLAWYSADVASVDLARALGRMTEVTFHSIRERGPWAKSAGNAAIWALGQMPEGVGVGPLARLRTKLRDRGALKLVAAGIESAAAKAGMTVDELEDLAVPTGGLDAEGVRHEKFGEVGAAMLRLDGATGQTAIEWFGADGKPRKAVPAAVKAEFGAEFKALKAAEEEIKQALGAQAARLDRALLDERTWTGAEWRERYLNHPVLGNLTRRLIWTFGGLVGLPTEERVVGADGQGLPMPGDGVTVRLWHPIGQTPAEVLRWRDALEEKGITQPFKQAHREVYLLTDAERNTRTYSNRFAAHVLKQHQFNSLAVLRGWKNQLRLMVDDSYPPATKLLPKHNLRAEFWVEGIGDDYGTDTNEAGTYLRLATDQVRFYALDAATNYAHAGGGGYAAYRAAGAAEPLPLDQIPPLVLSEVMRDVDLFVGVASLGNDPNWADGGPQGRFRNYWQDYSFGDLTETAKTRADVLGRLLPRLKIVDRCRLEGRFLVVRGDLRTYKIHLGSGNILMEPNDQYLCIVAKSGADDGGGGLMLPFEGDRMLSVIVSKAFLLAADTKITDPTITRQIGVH